MLNTLNTFVVVSATILLLAVLVTVCIYLLLSSYFHIRRQRKQEEYVHANFPQWQQAIFHGKPLQNLPATSKEYKWTIQNFLKILHAIDDSTVSRRIQEVSNTVFSTYLENELKSQSRARQQYALAVIHELGMTTLSEEVNKVQPASPFQASLKRSALETATPLHTAPQPLPSPQPALGTPLHLSPTQEAPATQWAPEPPSAPARPAPPAPPAPATDSKQEDLST